MHHNRTRLSTTIRSFTTAFFLIAGILSCAGPLRAQSKIEVAVVLVQSGLADDFSFQQVTQMTDSLNKGSTLFHYNPSTVLYFTGISNDKTEGKYKIVLAHASYIEFTGKFSGNVHDAARENGNAVSTPVNDVRPYCDELFHCGMDGDNAYINVDDMGRRIAAKRFDGYKDVTQKGPIAPRTPGKQTGGGGGMLGEGYQQNGGIYSMNEGVSSGIGEGFDFDIIEWSYAFNGSDGKYHVVSGTTNFFKWKPIGGVNPPADKDWT